MEMQETTCRKQVISSTASNHSKMIKVLFTNLAVRPICNYINIAF